MSSNGLGVVGGLLGAALTLYVIHEVLRDGRTGRRIGHVYARSKAHAKHLIQKKMDKGKFPDHVRVLYGKDLLKGHTKKLHTKSYNSRSGVGINVNVRMPRLF